MKSSIEVGKVVQHPALPPQLQAQPWAERQHTPAGLHLRSQGISIREFRMPVVPPIDDLVGLGNDGFRSSACKAAAAQLSCRMDV